jgi:hypothetical protein
MGKALKKKKIIEAYTFLVASMAIRYWYHFERFFDMGQNANWRFNFTLIFVLFPIYATNNGF